MNPFAEDCPSTPTAHAEPMGSFGSDSRPVSEFALVLESYLSRGKSHVSVPDGVTQILEGAFRGHDEIVSVSLPDTVQSVGPKAFSGCSSLREVCLPDAVFEVGRSAFSGCTSLERVVLPGGLMTVERSLFHGCSALTSVEGGAEVDSITGGAFSGCASLEKLPLLSHVREIGSAAFAGCGLSEVLLPPLMKNIGSEAFKSCRSLKRVVLPETVDNLGQDIFLNCSALELTEDAELLASLFPAAFPREVADKLGVLRPQDERRVLKEYIRVHRNEAEEVRDRLDECRARIRLLSRERNNLGVFDLAREREVTLLLEEERARKAAFKERLEVLEKPTFARLSSWKYQMSKRSMTNI